MVDSGQTLSHYTILRPLGKGGMGEVFLAEDTVLGRKVALKFLAKEAIADPVARGRFLREAKSAAAIDDPFICKIYETGEVDGEPFIAMEYIEGESLGARIERGPMSLEEVVTTAAEIAEALGVAHEHGIIHRDLKPANVMLTTQGHAKVLDFGLAKQVFTAGNMDTSAQTATSDDLTGRGVTLGTLSYMSPEQLRALPLTPKSDVFSFGIVLHEMLTGTHPFARPSSPETMSAIMADAAPTPESKGHKIPQELLEIHDKALAKEPEDRYQNASEVARELSELKQALAPTKKKGIHTIGIGIAMVLAAIVVVAGLRLLPRNTEPVAVENLEPMSVLIADFENQTGDEIFDGALEQALAIGLEEAPFINSYRRGRARQVAEQILGEEARLDSETARLVAQREAISVIVSGSIVTADPGYQINVGAIDGVTGGSIVTHETTVRSRDEVLPAVARLTVNIRRALGDTVPESVELAANETFTTASLEAAGAYARAQDLMAIGKWQEAANIYRHAIQLDSDFGRAYAGLAVCYLNLNQLENAKKYFEEAFSRIDRMTDREKFRTRGGYYLLTRNYEKAAEQYEALSRDYPSDPAGPSNLAFAYFYGRDMGKALEIGQRAADAHPQNVLTRANLALYAMYASDFETAANEAKNVHEANPSYETAYVPEAMALIDVLDFEGAAEVYDRLRLVSPWGASLAATGGADLALYQGRYKEAFDLLESGIAGDRANELDAEVARKLTMLAGAHMTIGNEAEAITAVDEALSLSRRRSVLFASAAVLVDAGQTERALDLSQELATQLEPEPRVFARLIESQIALAGGDPQRAIGMIGEAQQLVDNWMGRYLLGQAYLAAGAFTEAYSEFETCVKRRGEATSLFLDDVPSYSYFPPVYYYLGLAQQGLGSPAAAESFRTYVTIKEGGDGGPLVADARRLFRSD